ncbi:MAG: VPLPA-CTERM sorting domain-containing protein [Gammaproteobacteria bacterium]|nr:VPLPA-CTERM sorting domain-containing protein [Gammaproteobacteria bacterium]
MFKRLLTTCSLAIALMLGSPPAVATVIYDNFGSGDSFNTQSGYVIAGESEPGFTFTAEATGFVTSIDFGMEIFGRADPQTINFSLFTNADNNIGTLLEAFSVTVSHPAGAPGVSTGNLTGSTLLSLGQQYWLVGSSPDGVGVRWLWNTQNDTGVQRATDGTLFPFRTLPTFRVNADSVSVPEPGALVLVVSGLAAFAALRRRHRCAPSRSRTAVTH